MATQTIRAYAGQKSTPVPTASTVTALRIDSVTTAFTTSNGSVNWVAAATQGAVIELTYTESFPSKPGTLSLQDASSVAVTGGAIDGTSVGATTRGTGAFTSLVSYNLGVNTSPGSYTAGVGGDMILIAQYDPSIKTVYRVYNDPTKDWSTVNTNGTLSLTAASGANVFQIAPGGSTKLTLNTTLMSLSVPLQHVPYTVATLPAAGTAGRTAYCSNARMFNGTGTLEASGSGTGGLVVDNGSTWKIVGTNVTVSA